MMKNKDSFTRYLIGDGIAVVTRDRDGGTGDRYPRAFVRSSSRDPGEIVRNVLIRTGETSYVRHDYEPTDEILFAFDEDEQKVSDLYSEDLLKRLAEVSPMCREIFSHGLFVRADRDLIIVRFPLGSFFAKQAATPVSAAALALASRTQYGVLPGVVILEGDEEKLDIAAKDIATELQNAQPVPS